MSNTLTVNVDLGINFSLRIRMAFAASELGQPEKVNALISECLRLELPIPRMVHKADSVPEIMGHLKLRVADILHRLFGEPARYVEFTFTVNKPSVVLETAGVL